MATKIAPLRKYLLLKTSLEAVQAEIREIRPKVIEILDKAPDKQVSVDDKTLCLSTKQRTRFDMKEAKERLGKLLIPFFKTSEYPQIDILGELNEDE